MHTIFLKKSVFVPENQYFCHKESVFLHSRVGSYDIVQLPWKPVIFNFEHAIEVGKFSVSIEDCDFFKDGFTPCFVMTE